MKKLLIIVFCILILAMIIIAGKIVISNKSINISSGEEKIQDEIITLASNNEPIEEPIEEQIKTEEIVGNTAVEAIKNVVESNIDEIEKEETPKKNTEVKVEPQKQETKSEEKIQPETESLNTKNEEKKVAEQASQPQPQPQETLPNAESTPTNNISQFCIEGGKVHIEGDGDNEHGYYKTWDEAKNAFETYTKDWSSVQYKIGQCWCGLYYFWAIQ